MTHSFVKIWVHAIFGTKSGNPLILPEIKTQIHQILTSELHETGCSLLGINGMPDHVHVLFLLQAQKNIAEVIKHIKGSSSHKINQENLTKDKFSWQVGYGAFSVSESAIKKVQQYIKDQEIHHQKISFQEEFERFLELHGLWKG